MNTVSQAQHVCFYSNKCNWSKAFLEELSRTPWKGEFRFVCVDPTPSRGPLPAWLKKVPTLVISGESEPRTDGQVMNWLSERRLKSGGGQAASSSLLSNEPEGFSMMEHQSFTKGFGYSGLDVDTSTAGNGGASIPGAFSFLNGGASPGDRTGQQMPSMATVEKRSKKEQVMDKQMEDFMRERDRGMPGQMSRM
jgi:hypothetical protein